MIKVWSPTWGMGTLDYKPDVATFAADNGAPPIVIRWTESRSGQANQKKTPRKKADEAEWFEWLTFTSASGEVFSFRRGGPPAGATAKGGAGG